MVWGLAHWMLFEIALSRLFGALLKVHRALSGRGRLRGGLGVGALDVVRDSLRIPSHPCTMAGNINWRAGRVLLVCCRFVAGVGDVVAYGCWVWKCVVGVGVLHGVAK